MACISHLHCLQVTRKPEIWRLFPPSFVWQSPCLNCAHLADRQTGGCRARAGAGLCQPSIPAAWGHHQKAMEVLVVSVAGQHVLLSLAHSGTLWGLHQHEGGSTLPFPPCQDLQSQPRQKFNSSILGFSPPGTPRSFVISVLDLGTEKHASLPWGTQLPWLPQIW